MAEDGACGWSLNEEVTAKFTTQLDSETDLETAMQATATTPVRSTRAVRSPTADRGDLPAPTHLAIVGYILWIIGFTGAHRFYFGKPLTGALWFLTGGVFLIGWIIDVFLIPAMADEANRHYRPGRIDYTVTWCLLLLLGLFGVHRIYMGKIFTGILFMCTGALLGVGFIYDTCTLNEQVEEINAQ
jgi:TM2 domain-containing membrane protein YozV